MEGYVDVLHGGVICCLLDGAMTNCLFAMGRTCVTAKLNVRFRHPVRVCRPATVRARLERGNRPLYAMRACVMQDGQVMAEGTGKFMEKPPGSLTGEPDSFS
jgi:acyl-coenzyme A thioesterase PaaI-like protein